MDLSTDYMGLSLKNPLIGSSSPLWTDINNIKLFEDCGGAAIVLHSLFEEQLFSKQEHNVSAVDPEDAEYITYLPDFGSYSYDAEEYFRVLQRAKESVDIPVIASINGISPEGWVEYAREVQRCGADGLELNIYDVADNPAFTCSQVESRIFELIRAVRRGVSIPLGVKIGCFFSSIPNIVSRIEHSGVNAVVLFNRFYQPDIDLRTFEPLAKIRLSTSDELTIRLHWMAALHGRVDIDKAVTGGVHSGGDVIKCLAAGANAAMMTSALLINGIDFVREVLRDVPRWLEYHGYSSVRQLIGIMPTISLHYLKSTERVNYLRVLGSYIQQTKKNKDPEDKDGLYR
ncbi:dihydroorotate dehydrogenase [Chitinispirillum alkaliphilum]|nr:dihydroorotate dehydrogenase [Chitinispirillum alkaliphilum]